MPDVTVSDSPGVHEDCGQNLILNAEFENAPTFVAATNTANRWIDGTAAGSTAATSPYAWGTPTGGITSSANIQFDSSTSFSGTNSLKLSTLNATGVAIAATYIGSSPNGQTAIILYPSTVYTFTGRLKTNNVVTNGAYADIREYSSSFGTLVTNSTNKLSGTNDWTLISKSFTTNASTVYGSLILRNNLAGNVSDIWFDELRLTANTPVGKISLLITPLVTPGIQDVNGPKIWG